MKKFFLIFEDLLDITNKSVIGPIKADSEELLVEQLGLQILPKAGISNRYCDGTTASDDVIIYICQVNNNKIRNHDDLLKLAHRLHCDWY